MDLKLTTWERLTISQLIGRLQDDAALLHKAIRIFDAVELTDEEKGEINLRQVGDSLIWDEPERRWDVSIKDRDAASLVRMTVGAHGSWPAAKAREVAGLHETLGLDWPPEDGVEGT